MKIFDFLAKMQAVQLKAAVYDEAAAYLTRCVEEHIEIPVDIGDGRVPDDLINEVIQEMREASQGLADQLEAMSGAEVKDESSSE